MKPLREVGLPLLYKLSKINQEAHNQTQAEFSLPINILVMTEPYSRVWRVRDTIKDIIMEKCK